MSDARTEARRLLAELFGSHQRLGPGACGCGWSDSGGAHSRHLADVALLIYFSPSWEPARGDTRLQTGGSPVKLRQLMLRGPVEPVVPEEPKP